MVPAYSVGVEWRAAEASIVAAAAAEHSRTASSLSWTIVVEVAASSGSAVVLCKGSRASVQVNVFEREASSHR